jgi:RNA polymerase sigma-70 factor (ECF subfamily)
MALCDRQNGSSPRDPDARQLDPVAADIVAARGGCEAAMNRLFAGCRAYLLAVANSILPSDVRAKLGGSDVVQETLLQLQRNFDRFQGASEGELLAWLRGAVLNNAKNATRLYRDTQKRELRREVSIDDALSGAERDELVDPAVRSPGSEAQAAEEAAQLNSALARLPDDYRRVIELRHWECLPFAEIGDRMGRTPEAARKLWSRAVTQLKSEVLAATGNRRDRGHE